MKFSTKLMLTVAMVSVFAFSAAVSYADTTSWSIAGDFSETSNANGAWDYGYYGSPSGYTLFTQTVSTTSTWASARGFTGWVPATPLGCTDPGIIKNTSGASQTYAGITWAPGQLSLDPNSSAITTVRWTAPAAGTYKIDAVFTQLQGTAEQGAEVYIKGDKAFSQMLAGTGSTANYSNASQLLAAGDQVIFGAPGNGNGLVVGLSGTISLVPEPGTLVLLSTCLLGLLAYAWRKRK
jgi:hypothetical protein